MVIGRKEDHGGVNWIVIHLLVGNTQRRHGGQRLAAAGVAREARMGTTYTLSLYQSQIRLLPIF